MINRIYTLDISRYQHPFNLATLAGVSPLPAAVIHRATIGSLYRDPFFHSFCSGFAQADLPGVQLSAYHVLRPDYPAKDQAAAFLATLDGIHLTFPAVLDLELDCGKSSAAITLSILDTVKYLEDALQYTPILYSRTNWLNTYFKTSSAGNFFYWIAYYPQPSNPQIWQNYAKIPLLPEFVDLSNLVLHQVTDRANGRAFGAASSQIDLSYWCGSQPPEAFVAAHFSQPERLQKPCALAATCALIPSRNCPYAASA